ncbi:hypothetical protein M2164_001878 [Streptomyces sp. SAI-208]|nr:hypothetical protein [Streptomyces sp. SAI-208]
MGAVAAGPVVAAGAVVAVAGELSGEPVVRRPGAHGERGADAAVPPAVVRKGGEQHGSEHQRQQQTDAGAGSLSCSCVLGHGSRR